MNKVSCICRRLFFFSCRSLIVYNGSMVCTMTVRFVQFVQCSYNGKGEVGAILYKSCAIVLYEPLSIQTPLSLHDQLDNYQHQNLYANQIGQLLATAFSKLITYPAKCNKTQHVTMCFLEVAPKSPSKWDYIASCNPTFHCLWM